MNIIRSVLIFGIILLFGTVAFAQDDHKIEVTGDYSYIHANPQNNNIIPTFSLNGGGGSGAFYFSKYIGIEGEFQGYGSYTHNIITPGGLVSASGNLFTYNVVPSSNSELHISNHLLRPCLVGRTAISTATSITTVEEPASVSLPATMPLISSSAVASTFLWVNTSPLGQPSLTIY